MLQPQTQAKGQSNTAFLGNDGNGGSRWLTGRFVPELLRPDGTENSPSQDV